MIRLYAQLWRRAGEEDGVIALATLAFMISAGMATIVMLWSIGAITGAFNALYAANQAAAYAAASATKTPTGLGSNLQLPFDCEHNHGDATLCDGGKAFNAANAVMSTMLSPNRPGSFNLDYGVNAFLTDETYTRRNVIRSYEINRPAGQAKAQAEAFGCPIPANRDFGVTPINGNPNAQEINCWRLTEFGISFPVRYQNAIVTRSIAYLNIFPGCTLSICQIELRVVAAATEDQPTPFETYEDYFGNIVAAPGSDDGDDKGGDTEPGGGPGSGPGSGPGGGPGSGPGPGPGG